MSACRTIWLNNLNLTNFRAKLAFKEKKKNATKLEQLQYFENNRNRTGIITTFLVYQISIQLIESFSKYENLNFQTHIGPGGGL